MTTQSDLAALTPRELREYGFARVRDAAFDAVSKLWRRRQAEGMSQADLAKAIGADAAWVSRNLRGPGNWTLRTFGTFVEALEGDARIVVAPVEEIANARSNYHAYVGYEPDALTTAIGTWHVCNGPSAILGRTSQISPSSNASVLVS